jgi:hypothetical protein
VVLELRDLLKIIPLHPSLHQSLEVQFE